MRGKLFRKRTWFKKNHPRYHPRKSSLSKNEPAKYVRLPRDEFDQLVPAGDSPPLTYDSEGKVCTDAVKLL